MGDRLPVPEADAAAGRAFRDGTVDLRAPLPPWTRYGVTLTRLAPGDLELLRRHRNSPEIQRYMVYREHIDEAAQRRWFASIDNRHNFYSVIWVDGEAVGVSHTKNVDYETMSGEGGMMIWSAAHQNGMVPFRAALAGSDWMFDALGMRCIWGRVLKTNTRALRYNRGLGYVFDPEDPASETVIGRLTPESYDRATAALRRVLAAETG